MGFGCCYALDQSSSHFAEQLIMSCGSEWLLSAERASSVHCYYYAFNATVTRNYEASICQPRCCALRHLRIRERERTETLPWVSAPGCRPVSLHLALSLAVGSEPGQCYHSAVLQDQTTAAAAAASANQDVESVS